MTRFRLHLSTSILLLTWLPLQASIIQYNNQATWETASTNVQFLTLPGVPGTPDQSYPSGLTIDGVSFNGTVVNGGEYLVVRPTPSFLYGPADSNLGCAPQLGGALCVPGGNISVQLPGGVTSVGWDFGTFYGASAVLVRFSDGESFSGSGFMGFIGFTSTSPIGSFEIHSGDLPVLSNFSFGVTAAPEPSTFSLSVMGVGLALTMKRRHERLRRGVLRKRSLACK